MPAPVPDLMERRTVLRRRWLTGAGLLAGMLAFSNHGNMPVALARSAVLRLPSSADAWMLAFAEADAEALWRMIATQVSRSSPAPKAVEAQHRRKEALGFTHRKLEAMVVLRDAGTATCTPRQVFEFTGRQLVVLRKASVPSPGLRRFDAFSLTAGDGHSPETLNRLDSIALEAAHLGQLAFPWAWATQT